MNSVPAAFVQDVVRRSSKQDSAALSSFKEDTLWKSLSARLKHYEVGVSIDENGELRCIVYPVPSINSKSLSLDSFKATNPETHVIESFNICRPFWVSDKWARLPMDQMEAFYKFDLDRMSVQSTAGLYDSRVGSHNTALFEKFYQIFPSNFPFANLSLNYAGVQSEEFLNLEKPNNP
ncbi:hypothetical protein L596_021569 [Steinernema carpocapsae]|uniref:Uncharacterized protein n=1 Tax=Steinernema carpocapsae TaxID=34508 RepID=A0A4U5MJH3_STECR|nr:hypothetical protein L596_021569 [Steinernema carpocapsae]